MMRSGGWNGFGRNVHQKNVYSIGVDIVEVCRVRRLVENHSTMLHRLFTDTERAFFEHDGVKLFTCASRMFAMKEAVLKSCCIGWQEGVAWNDIELLDPVQCHAPRITGTLAACVIPHRVRTIVVTSSVNRVYAVAQAIAMK